MATVLFFKPVFHHKIWGGQQLKTLFGYDVPAQTGECWAISAQAHGVTDVANGKFAGQPLTAVWRKHPELFGMPHVKEFPLLVKILDAHADLSVQVHPADGQTAQDPTAEGKTESWLILAAAPGAKLYYGHTAQTPEELHELIKTKQWDKLLSVRSVKPGDFIYVPANTVHALGAGIVALELQQSSDTTYRLYDFDRVDAQTGQKRPLQIAQAEAVISTPQHLPTTHPRQTHVAGATITHYLTSPYFNVTGYAITTQLAQQLMAPYTLLSVIEGAGTLTVADASYQLHKGDHLLLANDVKHIKFAGKLHVIATTPGAKVE